MKTLRTLRTIRALTRRYNVLDAFGQPNPYLRQEIGFLGALRALENGDAIVAAKDDEA